MIYIHIPFCHSKCTYCAFHSRPVSRAGVSPYAQYVDALIEEMRQRKGEQAHPIRTVYFGGGTPSILPLNELERIVRALHECFDLSQVEECTLEGNPEDLTADYLRGLRGMGLVNRLSIGIQSLDDDMLRLIGRRHTAAQALAAVEEAHRAAFHNLSVDFIYGLPGNSRFSSLDFRLVSHVSSYALTVEPTTALARQVEQGRVALPDEDELVRQYYDMCNLLENNGLFQYEVSNFARPGFLSRHNSRYWDRTPYLGLGPSAHSCDGYRRRWNSAMAAGNGTWRVEDEETLTAADACNELLMTSLRTTAGLHVNQVPEAYRSQVVRKMQRYLECRWIVAEEDCYRPTREGLLYADGMAAALFVS